MVDALLEDQSPCNLQTWSMASCARGGRRVGSLAQEDREIWRSSGELQTPHSGIDLHKKP